MPPSRFNAALAAWQRGDRAEALELCNLAVQHHPDEVDTYRLLGEIHGAAGRVEEAISACEHVARLAPRDAANWRRFAVLLTQCRMPQAAATMLEKSLEIEPQNARALNNLGSLLNDMGRSDEAVTVLQKAVLAQPNYAVAMVNLGASLHQAGRPDEAIVEFDRAIALEGTLALAHLGRARGLAAAGRGTEAIGAYRQTASLNPKDPWVLTEMGHLMLAGGSAENALSAFSGALDLVPGDIAAQEGRLLSLMELKRHEAVIAAVAALRVAAPWNHYLQGHQLHAQLQCADWSELPAASQDIAIRVRRGERVELPLSFLVHNESPADQLACARTYIGDRVSAERGPPLWDARRPRERLRIAYLSPDFNEHPVAQLIAGVIEAHDRRRFEIHAFSTGRDDGSSMRRRLESGFDHFHHVATHSDLEIARRMASADIDVAVDLGGHTTGSRVQLLVHRPAPLQVSFLGFPGTTGADFIDYIVADRHVIPVADQAHYTEKVIYLPDSYLPGALPIGLGARCATDRVSAGLPSHGFVYCGFNSIHKILPTVFDSWMRILGAVPDSVLWLRDGPEVAKRNLAREAAARGVDPARLVYASKVPTLADHIARLGLAGLFLDTRPYNAHTTASDALAAGLPVLTICGNSFASRVATSLVSTAGLRQLSVSDEQQYERLAVDLAQSPDQLADLKATLVHEQHCRGLFDTARFCRALESGYAEIVARHARGEQPSALYLH